jgi:thiol-disulfide isomerase/thioredoxin
MRKLVLIVFITLNTYALAAQQVDLIKYDQLKGMFQSADFPLTVVNFWATWCGPCVKELPYFEAASEKEGVRVILVSLDFPEEKTKVEKFAANRLSNRQVYLLDEVDYDSYMPKISVDWSGALPATLMIEKGGKEHFFEKAFTKAELFNTIDSLIN